MIKFNLSDLKFTPEQLKGNRERSLESVKKWKEADEALTKLCLELGIDKPVMVC
ncbi:hypothetical protein [Pseudomonas sp.]|uniref:hypothetical protein n=1 Tax=Pseudomonas sp. TaxID=306 RepID=UPI003FD88B44